MRLNRTIGIESLESRTLMSVAEPNNTLASAVVVDAAGGFGGVQMFSDSISPSDTVDFYRINAPANTFARNQSFAAKLTGLTGDLTLTLIHDLNGNLVEDAGEISVSSAHGGTLDESLTRGLITSNGVYFLKITGASAATSSNYTLTISNDTAGDTTQTTRLLPLESGFVSDSLDNLDIVDLYRLQFNGIANSGNFAVRLSAATPSNYHVDIYLDSNHNGTLEQSEFVTSSRPSNGGQEIVPMTLQASNSYYLKVINSFANGSENYTLHTQWDYAGATTATARFLGGPEGRLVSGRDQVGSQNLTSFLDSADLFKFVVVNPGFTAVAQVTLLDGFSPASSSLTKQLFKDANNNGVLEASESLGVISTTSTSGVAVLKAATGPGTYYLKVTGSQAPNYEMFLGLDRAPGITGSNPSFSKSLDIGTFNSPRFVEDGLGAGDASDTYKFRMPKKGSATFNLQESFSQNASPISGSIAFDTNGNGTRDAGETIGTFDFTHPLTISLNTGTYYVTLAGGLHYAYELRMTPDFVGNSPAKALSLGTLGAFTSFSDILAPAPSADLDYFKFTLASAQTFTASVLGSDDLATTTITLYKDNGGGSVTQMQVVTGKPGGSALLQSSLPAGNYQVALSVAGNILPYSVGFSTGDNDDAIPEADVNANVLVDAGQFKDFTISNATDVDMIKFFASDGDKLTLDVDSRGGSNFDTFLRLFDATGKQVASNDNGAAPGETTSKFSFLTYTVPNTNSDGVVLFAAVSSAGNNSYNALTGAGDTGGSSSGQYRITLNNLTPHSQPPAAGSGAPRASANRDLFATTTIISDLAGDLDPIDLLSRNDGAAM